jgi:hypothetical protein
MVAREDKRARTHSTLRRTGRRQCRIYQDETERYGHYGTSPFPLFSSLIHSHYVFELNDYNTPSVDQTPRSDSNPTAPAAEGKTQSTVRPPSLFLYLIHPRYVFQPNNSGNARRQHPHLTQSRAMRTHRERSCRRRGCAKVYPP